LDSNQINRCDSIALRCSKQKFNSVQELSLCLNSELETQKEWAYVFAKWCSYSLSYTPRHYVSSGNMALKKGKVVCQGYSLLAQEYFTCLGMYCKYIVGDSKTSVEEIGKKLNLQQHAWNAIKIDDQLLLFDFTWSASAYSVSSKKYVSRFDPSYLFCSPFEFYLLGHFPRDEGNLFMKCSSCKREYINNPIYHKFALQDSILAQATFKSNYRGKVKVSSKQIDPNKIQVGYYCNRNESILILDPILYTYRDKKVIVKPKYFNKSKEAVLFVDHKMIQSINR